MTSKEANYAIGRRVQLTINNSAGERMVVVLAPEGMAQDKAESFVKAMPDTCKTYDEFIAKLEKEGFAFVNTSVTVDIDLAEI